ncbi:hypothetical protein NKJ04_17670 [Mesorhizobium sp. M0618]|uniref:hypothetical protein n=1 Tax=Mesorhizobium sp. M0618 TaxID=2956972 RepID=UPI00333618F1
MGNTSYRLGATEKLPITNAAAASQVHGDSEVNTTNGDHVVRIQADVDCFVLVGKTPVASVSNGFPVAAGAYEYIDVPDGHKLSAITASGAGNLYITDVSKI